MIRFRVRLPMMVAFILWHIHLNGQSVYPSNFVPHGPGGGGYMYSPSISPHNPELIFLNCDMGGVYRSENGGQTWEMQHYQNLVSTVKGKVQFTANPEVLYVCRRSLSNPNDPLFRGELAKSTDGGISWQPMNDPTATGVHRLDADPGSTQRLILNEYDRLFFSDNGGGSWSEIFHPSDDQMWLGGVFWDGVHIYVGTNKGLLVSHDNGQSFSLESHAGIPAGAGILQLSGAKSGGTTRLFAIAATASEMYAWLDPLDLRDYLTGFYRLDYTANAAWTNTRGNIPVSVRIAWADLATNNTQTVWAAGEDGGLPMIFKSDNGGQSWTNTFLAFDNQNVSTGWGGDYGAFSYLWSGAALGFEVSDSDPNHVIVTDGFGHITTDGGASWRATYVQPDYQNPAGTPTPVNKFYQSSGLNVTTAHQLFWLNDQELYSANTDIGLTYSADAGKTWTFARNTFYPWGTVANPNWYRMVQRPDNQHLFAALAEVNDLYLGYRITDDQVAGAGLVAKSVDNGASWDTTYNFGHPVVWIELDKNDPNRMFASVVDSAEGGIYRSNNSGLSWSKLSRPPRTEGHPYNIICLNDGGLAVTFSARAQPDGVTLTESSGVFYSPDGGNTWEDRSAEEMKFYTKELVIDPNDPDQNTWYATVWGRFTVFPGPNNAGNGGLYKSTDRGLHWVRILSLESAESLSIHPSKAGAAYLSAENDGLYYTENLDSAQPSFERVNSFPFWRPKRIFFKPNNPCEVWITTMGGGLWSGETSTEVQIANASNISICDGTSETLHVSGGGFVSYSWYLDGLEIPGAVGDSLPAAIAGDYKVYAVNASGCGNFSNEVHVDVYPLPLISFDNGVLLATPASAYQWLLNGNPIPGATEQSFTPLISGDYAVQVECPGNGAITSNVITVTLVGIPEIAAGRMKLYPNPVWEQESRLTLELLGVEAHAFTVFIKDLSGREVFKKHVDVFAERTMLETGSIPAGSYFVQVVQAEKTVLTGLFFKI